MTFTFVTDVVASGTGLLADFIGGVIQLLLLLGPYILGLIALAIIIGFIRRVLGWGKKVGRSGR